MLRSFGSLVSIALIFFSAPAVAQYRTVTFNSKSVAGRTIALQAKLLLPRAGTPAPAVVLMHGCGGLRAWGDIWAQRLAGWGYVVIRPDSFGPRGISDCATGNATVDVRADDAVAAWRYLARRRDVNRRRIAVMGMFHGGTAALISVGGKQKEQRETFAATIALYPRCYQVTAEAVLSPVLILIGQRDHLSPANTCQKMGTKGTDRHPLDVIVYPGATHAFDWPGLDMVYFGRRVQFDETSSASAVDRAKAFLKAHLKGPRKPARRRK